MRIGIMAAPWVPVPPPAYGGTETVIDHQARGFAAAGHDVFLFTLGQSTCPVEKGFVLDNADGIDIGVGQYEWQHVIHGYRAMREWGADIVHDHGLAGLVYSERFPEMKVITTNHGPFGGALGEVYKLVSPRVPVIGISYDQVSKCDDGINLARVIHHGVNAEDFPFGKGLGDERGEYFLFLGRMHHEKGVVEAAIAAREAGVRLKIAAKMREEYEHRYFKENVEPLLDDDIVYVGEPNKAERDELLGNASALLNPIPAIRNEPFGMVMIESLACGTPVIATRRSTAPEIIEQGVTGFLCQDLGDFITAFGKVDTIDRADCRSAVENHFSSARMSREYLEVFENMVEGRPPTFVV